jgi:hypothetical protein
MSRVIALAVLVALPGAPLLALARASDARAAMACCKGDACPQEIGQARECCAISPAAPDERPALKVERRAASIPAVSAVLPTLALPAGVSRTAASPAVALDTSPSRPVVLRL